MKWLQYLLPTLVFGIFILWLLPKWILLFGTAAISLIAGIEIGRRLPKIGTGLKDFRSPHRLRLFDP